MTHVANPDGLRLGITKEWRSNWFAKNRKDYRRFLQEDTAIRTFLNKELRGKMVADISLERDRDILSVVIKTARPGLIIGRDGVGIEDLNKKIQSLALRKGFDEKFKITIRIEEVRNPETSAVLIAEGIGEMLQKRMPHRRVLKQTAEKVIANREVKGVRIILAGRLGGAEIARSETIKKGNIPLQTLRANISFVSYPVVLAYGTLNVKVWVYLGEVDTNKK